MLNKQRRRERPTQQIDICFSVLKGSEYKTVLQSGEALEFFAEE
jgi:hypothetical protein